MSEPSQSAIVAAIVAALSVDHDDALDLSVAGRVLRGRYAIPPVVPFAAVSGTVGRVQRSAVTTGWEGAVGVDVVVWGLVSSVALHDRVAGAEVILDLVIAALQTAADTPGNALRGVPDLAIEPIAIDADLEGAAEHAAQVVLGLTWTLRRTSPGLSS